MSPRLFGLFGSTPSKQPAGPEIAAEFAQARALTQQGRWSEAAAICCAILERHEDHVESLMLSAEIAVRERDPARAIDLYTRITKIKPKDAAAYYKRGNVLRDCGQMDAALDSYDRAVALAPDYADAFCNRGTVLERLERLDAALDSYDRAVSLNASDAFAYFNRGNLLRRLERSAEALANYSQAIAVKPEFAEAYFFRGTLQEEVGRRDEALESYEKAIAIAPGIVHAHLRRGRLLRERQQTDAALASYEKAIEIAPRFAEAHSYRGALLYDLEQLDAALNSYEKAIEIDPGFAEAYYNRGVLRQARKQYDAAIADYDKTISLIPHYAEAYLNRGAIRHAQRRTDEALADYDEAAALDPGYAEAFVNRGTLLLELGRPDAALASFDRGVELAPQSAGAHYGRGEAQSQLHQFLDAIASFDRVLAIKPHFPSVLGKRTHVKMSLCDWRDFETEVERITAGILEDRPVSAPLPVSALVDEPSLQHRAAQIWVREECPPDDALGSIPARTRDEKIRLGYFSADFRNHSVARLTAGLFESHDRSRFEITAFSFGPDAHDEMRARIERGFDRFIDVRDRTDLQVAALARDLEIDIAIDLGGFTEYSRTKIFALRAAPIQVSYIGYLGTMGASYMDYLVADSTIVPVTQQGDYSEKIIYLPSYQANDSQRRMNERTFTREELGLPSNGFVFSCFNTIYKLLPSTFTIWMRILNRVPDSTLFLYAGNPIAEANLKEAAERHGITSHRIVFARNLRVEDYLARFRTMDLFLDTWPYNAGTTASDALWAGLPLLTCMGRSFASRCAASLLKAIDLPELITADARQYEDLAVQLATDPQHLKTLRKKLADRRDTALLFDTPAFVRHLEAGYAQVWDRYQARLPPEHIHVPELRANR
jgi:predicted O-linked N-acetylglucosamine transferase (SPINDLY family)